MYGGSIIRSSCGTASSAGASRALLLPTTAGSTLLGQARFNLPPASRSQIHALLTDTSPCSRSTPSLCDEDPSLDEEEENVKKTWTARWDLNIFRLAPSKEEAEAAISSLKLVSSIFVGDKATEEAFDQTTSLNENTKKSTASCSEQSKPGQLAYGLKSAQYKVLNALRLLRINASVQSMVVSLSSDKAVWNAVMKNERVQELMKSFRAEHAGKGSTAQGSDDITVQILRWFFENAKAQVMRFIEDIITLVNKLFNAEGKEGHSMEIVSDVVRSSFMVSVMVFIVVVLKRIA